jgi:dTDP-4-dehydrorhamnose reductase
MKPAILLIGANGQVGRELAGMLPQLGDVTALDRQRLDLTKPEEIRRAIRNFRPAWIVNAAAYTAVDNAESDEALAQAINAVAPAVMAEEAKKIGASVVHYSTDYVFDGSKTAPYGEDDPANPQTVYGKTKLEGERAIQASGVPYLIFRVAWVYATQGRNFLLTILRFATQREELRVVRDQNGAPTLSNEIAKATTDILFQICRGTSSPFSLAEVSGIYHLTAAGETTWYGFAKAILKEASRHSPKAAWLNTAINQQPLITRRLIPITTDEYPTLARRPAYSVLSNARLTRIFGLRLPDWQMQLRSLFNDDSSSFQSYE